jgi:branched-chain amino acid transport system ATP-binding protein
VSTGPADVVLAAEHISGGYTHAEILHDVSLSVGAGEVVAVFGANGAGKTTLLRALDGSLPRCEGTVRLHGAALSRSLLGRTVRMPPERRARLGLAHVPEGRHVFPSLTVKENLSAGALARRGGDGFDRVYALFPRLKERRDQKAGSLSGGEQQMLVIGRALMSSPQGVLIDEMSAGLAPVMTERLVEGLAEVRTLGVAVLLVEQAPQLIEPLVDRAYLLAGGRVVADGSLAALGGADRIAELYLGVH